jgi:hypothetical protein
MQQRPHRPAERTGEVRRHAVHRDHEVERRDDARRARDVVRAGHDPEAGRAIGERRTTLQDVELYAG